MVLRKLTSPRRHRILPFAFALAVIILAIAAYFSEPALKAAPPERSWHDFHLIEQEMNCTDCHVEKQAASKETCSNCHDAADVERLFATFRMDVERNGAPRPASHASDWRRAHGAIAGADPGECFVCHEQSTCQDCHEGENIRANIHPLNYRYIHAFDARGHEQDCLVCHETRDFCVDCHRQTSVLTHPLGPTWANSDGGEHAEEAEADLESCLACHDMGRDDPVCTRPGCHDSAGGGE